MTTDEEEFESLFGDMDIEDIPDDPWFVGAGTYKATVTKSERKAKKDSSGWAFIINYTIDEPDSQYHGFTKGDWFNLYPGMKYEDLEPEQKQDVIRMKARLREAFDKTEEEVRRVKPEDLVGEDVYLTVVERAGQKEHTGKTFSNIGKVQSKRLYEEENQGKADTSMDTVGLSGA